MRPGELIEASDDFGNQRAYNKGGEAAKREAVDIRAETLLDGTNGTFDLANMTVGSDDVNVDGGQRLAEVAKFMVTMNINDLETTGGVELDHTAELGENGFDGTVSNRNCSVETDVTGYTVEETMVHDKKESHA